MQAHLAWPQCMHTCAGRDGGQGNGQARAHMPVSLLLAGCWPASYSARRWHCRARSVQTMQCRGSALRFPTQAPERILCSVCGPAPIMPHLPGLLLHHCLTTTQLSHHSIQHMKIDGSSGQLHSAAHSTQEGSTECGRSKGQPGLAEKCLAVFR